MRRPERENRMGDDWSSEPLPQTHWAMQASGPGGDAAPVAYRSLTPHAHHHQGVIQKEWTAEDPVFFQISIYSVFHKLSLVI
ncbi:unnamed protein product [Nyctereutes procyonoides]|uniref:(raccoon dog) hypothetical protein n=1 Tax=Nyctereutes procyonoides TaxID=34880 RepID=A0A811Z224_NYCPR|nr:unnamed protein product [Nyctereutes procyonoides]